jgi:hypothetical protein
MNTKLVGLFVSVSILGCSGVDPALGDAAPQPPTPPPNVPDGGEESDAGTGTASDGQIDAAVVAPPACDMTKQIQPAVSLGFAVNSSFNDDVGSLTQDELVIFFSRGTGNYDIYFATRTSKVAQFGSATLVGYVNDGNLQLHPSITADSLRLYQWSNGFGATSGDILVSTRAKTTDGFSKPTLALVGGSSGWMPFVTADGSELYFGGSGGISEATCATDGTCSNPHVVVPAPTSTGLDAPTLTKDGLTMYASWTQQTVSGVYRMTRPTTNDAFGAPVSVIGLPSDAKLGWISPDGCRLYFSSATAYARDMFVAEYPAL